MVASCEGSAAKGACRSSCARFSVGQRSREDLFSSHCRYARVPSTSATTATSPMAPAATFERFTLHQSTVRANVEMNSSGPFRSRRLKRVFSAISAVSPWSLDDFALYTRWIGPWVPRSTALTLHVLSNDRSQGIADLLSGELFHGADFQRTAESLHPVPKETEGVLSDAEIREGIPHDGQHDPRGDAAGIIRNRHQALERSRHLVLQEDHDPQRRGRKIGPER